MPVTYGGGIVNLNQIEQIISLGIERVSINSFGLENTHFFERAVQKFGSSTILCSIDVKKNKKNNYDIYTQNGKKLHYRNLHDTLQLLSQIEVGEIIINSIDNDGVLQGYDFDLLSVIINNCDIPVTIIGGASSIDDFKKAIEMGASAVSAGSMFVFYGPLKAVLINYPSKEEVMQLENTIKHGK